MKRISKIFSLFVILSCALLQNAFAQDASNKKFIIEPAPPAHVLKSVRLSNGVHLEYAEKGTSTGTPIIFLHGITDSWHSFDMVLPLLPASLHAYAISQRGHGNSDRPVSGYKPEDFASDVADFMDKLKIESAIIVGHSMGGTAAQRFALDYSQKTKGLVLIGSFASYKDRPVIDELRAIIAKLEDPIDPAFVEEFQKSTLYNPIPASSLQTFVNESMKVPARVWKSAGDGMLTVDYSKELEKVSIPTLIMWGAKDGYVPEADQHIMKAAIKNSSLLIYNETGHAIHWEVPERFVNDLVDFINKTKESKTQLHEIDFVREYSAGIFY